MINILKKLSLKLEQSTNPFIIMVSFFFLFLGKIALSYKKIIDRIIQGPKIKYKNGDKYYYKNRKLHRDNDLPAIECKSIYESLIGDKSWYQNGLLHRDNDLPAIEREGVNGSKKWYKNGLKHRDNGPAVVIHHAKWWYQNGLRHRLDGLAYIDDFGKKEWWIEGVEYSKEDFNKKIKELYKLETKIDNTYISYLEDWDERFEENNYQSNHCRV